MPDGEWKITQYAPAAKNGFKVTTIPVRFDPNSVHPQISSPTNPWWLHDTTLDGPCLRLAWHDGREEHYPWASIVKAEYTPPTP